jgi:putative salt-induced outer membrane protein YdiY
MLTAQVEPIIEAGELVDIVEEEPIWKGSFAAGLNGKTGNSQNIDINFALNLTRETDFATTNILANYFYASNDVATTTDRWFSQARQEINFSNPRWSWFNQLGVEIDRFKAYDYRVALHTGLAYKLIDEDIRKLKLRFGGGASREVGGTNDDWSPELQLGADWERQLFESTKIYASFDYFPNVSDFGDYRLNTNTGLDFLVNEARNINFRIFAQNRYDSTPPPGNKASDLDYGAALVVGF